MNNTEQQPRTVNLPVMTVTYELRSDTLEQMTLTEPKEWEAEEVGPEKEGPEKEEQEEEEVGQEETGVELAVVEEDWQLAKAHCVFAGVKKKLHVSF